MPDPREYRTNTSSGPASENLEREKIFFLTINFSFIDPQLIRDNRNITFVPWIVDDLRFVYATFFDILSEPNVIMLFSDRYVWSELLSRFPEKVFHVPWASFLGGELIRHLSSTDNRVVLIGNLIRYLRLPCLEDIDIDSPSKHFLKALADELLQDTGFDIRTRLLDALLPFGLNDTVHGKYVVRSRLEYMVRSEANRLFRLETVQTIVRSGLPVHVYGDSSWGYAVPQPGVYLGPVRNSKEQMKALSTATVFLSLDAITMPDGVKMGTLDSVAMGVFTIANYTPYIDEVFEGSIPSFRKMSELPSLIEYYFENEEERREKTRLARAIVEATHSARVCALRIMTILESFERAALSTKSTEAWASKTNGSECRDFLSEESITTSEG